MDSKFNNSARNRDKNAAFFNKRFAHVNTDCWCSAINTASFRSLNVGSRSHFAARRDVISRFFSSRVNVGLIAASVQALVCSCCHVCACLIHPDIVPVTVPRSLLFNGLVSRWLAGWNLTCVLPLALYNYSPSSAQHFESAIFRCDNISALAQ